MTTCELNSVKTFGTKPFCPPTSQVAVARDRLHLVSSFELEDLRGQLVRGRVPPDLETKLAKLSRGDVAQRSIERNCRTIIALLAAAHEGVFKETSLEHCERLLRALEYVRKDDDAIPDYRVDGFIDDLKEMQMVTRELNSFLQNFKAWRLRHQVPGMWNRTSARL